MATLLLLLMFACIYVIGGIVSTLMDWLFPRLCKAFGMRHPNLPTILMFGIASTVAAAFTSAWFCCLDYLDYVL